MGHFELFGNDELPIFPFERNKSSLSLNKRKHDWGSELPS